MFYKFKSIFLSSILIISACGGGGSENYNVESVNPVSGTAVKGIIKNGIVNIYGVSENQKNPVPLATGSTDENGNYNLEIENYVGPIFVEVTADPVTSKMICDIRPSCEGVQFGEEVDLDNNFKIKAVVGKLEKDTPVTTNINTLTTLVAASVEEKNKINLSQVNNANSEVAELFGVEGKLSEMTVLDITNPESLANASDDDLYMSVMNSAIAANALNDGNDLAEGLNNLFSDFAESGGFLNNGTDTDVSVESIFTSASEIFESDEFSDIPAGGLKAKISIKKVQASMMAPGSKSVSMPTEQPKENSIEEAKTLIDSLRYFLLSTSYEESNEFKVMEDLGSALDLTNSYELDTHIAALELATEGFASIYYDFSNNTGVERGDILDYYGFDIEVIKSSENGDLELKIDDMIDGIEVNLSAKYSGLTNTNSIYEYFCEFDDEYPIDQLQKETSYGSFSISGDMKGNDLVAKVSEGDVSAKYNCNYLRSRVGDNESETWDDYIDVSMDLKVEITETTNNPLTFTGKILYDSEFSATYKDEYIADDHSSDDYSDSEYPYDEYDSSDYSDSEYPYDEYDSSGDYSDSEYPYDEYSDDYSDLEYSNDEYDYSGDYSDSEYPYDEYSDDYSDSEYSNDEYDYYDDYGDYGDYGEEGYPNDYEAQDYDDGIEAYTMSASFTLSGEFEKNNNKMKLSISTSLEDSNNEENLWANNENLKKRKKLKSSTNSEKISIYDVIDSLFYPDAIEIDTDESSESLISMSIDLGFDTSNSNDITGISMTTSNAAYGENRMFEVELELGNKKLIIDMMPESEGTDLIISNQNGTRFNINEDCDNEEYCKLEGAIVADNTTVGALSYDSDNDIYIMTYTDLSSEELAL